MAIAARLADLIAESREFELWAPPVTGVVNWRTHGQDAAAVRSRLRGAWVSLAEIADESWFRSVAANPLADPERALTAVRRALDAS